MDAALTLAGTSCLVLGCGHATVGLVWVLPAASEVRVGPTPLGPPLMTEGLLRVTWHFVTIAVLAVGGVLLSVARETAVDPRRVVLQWVAALFLAETAMTVFVARRRFRYLLRLPVWLLWLLVAALCWQAAS